jgi:toxin ParE1/3/4
MKRLTFSPRATDDIDQIYDYTDATWGLAQADAYVRGLRQECQSLANGIKRGRKITVRRSGYLLVAFQSHFIAYKETDRLVIVVRILHRRMNIANHL